MKRGEIISLGEHRLMCGDATNFNDVQTLINNELVDLVFTDPPYGINIQDRIKTVITNDILPGQRDFKILDCPRFEGDNNTDAAKSHYEIAKRLTDKLIIWGGQYFSDFLTPHGGWLFWDKDRQNSNIWGAGELAYCTCNNVIRKYKCNVIGDLRLNPFPRIHPIQKPVELFIKILEDFSNPNDVVLDCFGGSGTTLIACQITGRRCFMMEIVPDYCNLIINRWENLSPIFKAKNLFLRGDYHGF